jgi:hypothetical protein
LRKELAVQTAIFVEQEKASKDLDTYLSKIKKMAEDLKHDKSYEEFGYVTKEDLIEVYK